MIIIICTTAGAAVIGALTAPSDTGGTVEACFVSASVFEKLKAGKDKAPFDAALLEFEGQPLPFDKKADILYIPQSCETEQWEGKLQLLERGWEVCILNSDDLSKQQCVEEGKAFKIVIAGRERYMECSLIFTGLPVVEFEHEGDSVELSEEYTGTVRVLDPYRNEYADSLCTFHIRGNTSVFFDKKSYRLELKNSAGDKTDMSFLGMRIDDDWILNSMSTDLSLAREKVCYELWKKLNDMEEQPVASSQIEYAELFINGEYQGVYGLMYPVDGKLMGMDPGDLLYKVMTWKEEMDVPGKLTDHNGEDEAMNTNGFAYAAIKYPNGPESSFIWDPFEAYQDMVFETGDMKAMEEAGVRLNRSNFILHELFCEMTKAGDNTWKNLFIAAYRDGSGDYTLSETIWDLNYTFGDRFVWDPDNGNTLFDADGFGEYKLRYDRDYGYTVLASVDPGIRDETKAKWKKWREAGISPEYVGGLFEKESEYLSRSGAFGRNSDLWYAGSADADTDKIVRWIGNRFDFLDQMYKVK